MKKIFSAIAATALAAALVIFAAGCSKSAGKSSPDDSSVVPKAQSSVVQQSSKAQSSQSSQSSGFNQNSQTSQSSQTSQAGAQGESGQAVTQAALDYYGGSTANGDSVSLVNTVTTPEGTTFSYVIVTVGGNTYPLYVSNDGSYAMLPDDFNSVYGGGSEADNGGGDNVVASYVESEPDNDWNGGNDYGYDNDYNGPDHAEP